MWESLGIRLPWERALHTVNVDASAPALELARRNYALNGYDADTHEFHATDVNRYLQTAAREAPSSVTWKRAR